MPKPEDYGLREYKTCEGKYILVAKDHEDVIVNYVIGASLGTLTAIGEYLGKPKEVIEAFKLFDKTYAENPEKTGEFLKSNEKLRDSIEMDTYLAGTKLIQNTPLNQLQTKYLQGLSKQNSQIILNRIYVYYDALQQAKLTATSLYIAFLQSSWQNRNSNIHRYSFPAIEQDNTIYSPDECIGPVIMGECYGTILPKPGYHEKCYGSWLNGQCIGPQF